MRRDGLTIVRHAGAGALVIVATIHANWARGSAWPARDKHTLAQAVIGHDAMPSAPACLTVATLLLVGAAGVTAGRAAGPMSNVSARPGSRRLSRGVALSDLPASCLRTATPPPLPVGIAASMLRCASP